MSLQIQKYRLREILETGMNLGGFAGSTDLYFKPAVRAIGQCFALDRAELEAVAQQSRERTWRNWLLRRVVIGLWEESSRDKVYVGYTLHPDQVRVFFCSRQKDYPEQFSEMLTKSPAYIESGRDGFPVGFIRSLAYWKPRGPVVALWPQGLDSEFDGVEIPTSELEMFNHGDCGYHYLNRWDGGEMSLEAVFSDQL